MAWRYLGLAAVVIYGAGVCFYPLLGMRRQQRTLVLLVLLTVVFCSPCIVPGRARLLRFVAAVLAIKVGLQLYDSHAAARAGIRSGFREYLANLSHPFALVWRKVSSERRPRRRDDVRWVVTDTILGAAAIVLVVGIFQIHWRHYLNTFSISPPDAASAAIKWRSF